MAAWKSCPSTSPGKLAVLTRSACRCRKAEGHHGEIQQPYFFDGEQLIFDGWSDGGDFTHDITVSEKPTTITANFTRQVLLDTVPGRTSNGVVKVEPSGLEGGQPGHTFHDLSSSVQLTAQPDPGFKFYTWRGNLSGSENPQSLLMDSPKQVRATFRSQSFEWDRLISGEPVEWLFGPGSHGVNDYSIDVPTGATQLTIHLATATPGTDVDLHVYGFSSEYLSTGPGGNKSITITPESGPPLEPGLYFIAVNARTAGRVKGTLTAEVNVSESAISANVPHFGFPASLFTKTVKDKNPPPQALEIRNSLGGTLDYQITTDQSWLFVSPNHGSSTGETDTLEIAVDPLNLEPGAFEGVITITAPPAWPVKVPVTLIVTQDQGQFTWDNGKFPRLDFAHFGNGDGITSDFVLVNVAPHPIRPAILFLRHQGQSHCSRIGGGHHRRSGDPRRRCPDGPDGNGTLGRTHDLDPRPRGRGERIGESDLQWSHRWGSAF